MSSYQENFTNKILGLVDPDPKVVMGEMEHRINAYYNFLVNTGYLGLLRKSYQQYYPAIYRGGVIRKSGDRGEIADFTTSDYRNLLTHQHNLVTGSRIKWDVKATNADRSSQAQTLLAPGLLDYYGQQKGATNVAKKAFEFNQVFGTGYVMTRWDETAGTPIAPDETSPFGVVKDGDIEYRAYNCIDVTIDPTLRRSEDVTWYITRDFERMEDMLGLYPQLEKEIRAAAATYDPRREIEDIFSIRARMVHAPSTCLVWTLWHEKTPSCPNGRILKMLGSKTLISDEPLYTETVPLARMQTNTVERTPLGYSEAWDNLAIQQVRDIAIRSVTTNVANTGITNILNPAGSNISVRQLRGGMNILEHAPGLEPKALVLEATSQNVFNLDKLATGVMQVNMGINDVQRGIPDTGIKAGVALALVQSMAVQYQSRHNFAWAQALEKIGKDTLDTLKSKVSGARKIAIVGKMQGQYLNEFTGQDLEGIDRVTVDLGNPLTATVAGRANIATEMLANGLIRDKEEYLQVLSIGNLEPVMQPAQAESLRIKAENEDLLQGTVPPVLYTDRHPHDLMEHLALLSSPESRSNPQVVEAVTAHVNTHIDLWGKMTMNQPGLLMALGIPPLQLPPNPVGQIPLDQMEGPQPLPPPMPIGPDGMPLPPEGIPPGSPGPTGPMPPPGPGAPPSKKVPLPTMPQPPGPPPAENQFRKPKMPNGQEWTPTSGPQG